MAIEDVYGESTEKVLDHMAKHPQPERKPIDQGIDFNETIHQTKSFISDHSVEFGTVAVLLILVIALRRAYNPRFSRWANPLGWVGLCAMVAIVTTVFLGPKGGAWVSGIILVTAFNRWCWKRTPK